MSRTILALAALLLASPAAYAGSDIYLVTEMRDTYVQFCQVDGPQCLNVVATTEDEQRQYCSDKLLAKSMVADMSEGDLGRKNRFKEAGSYFTVAELSQVAGSSYNGLAFVGYYPCRTVPTGSTGLVCLATPTKGVDGFPDPEFILCARAEFDLSNED